MSATPAATSRQPRSPAIAGWRSCTLTTTSVGLVGDRRSGGTSGYSGLGPSGTGPEMVTRRRRGWVGIGRHEQRPVRQELREIGQHDARKLRIIERVRLVACQREADERAVVVAVRLDGEIAVP